MGLDPLATFLAAADARFGHMLQLCADPGGGFPAIGIKWIPKALLPGPLKGGTAAGVLPLPRSRGEALQVVPNVVAVLEELAGLGIGLISEVVVLE